MYIQYLCHDICNVNVAFARDNILWINVFWHDLYIML
jgi:hypothetical protein